MSADENLSVRVRWSDDNDRFATDDRVVCRWRVTGAPSAGSTGTATAVEVEGISVWEFEDGKARRGWVCSSAAFLEQQGTRDAHAYSLRAHESPATRDD